MSDKIDAIFFYIPGQGASMPADALPGPAIADRLKDLASIMTVRAITTK